MRGKLVEVGGSREENEELGRGDRENKNGQQREEKKSIGRLVSRA